MMFQFKTPCPTEYQKNNTDLQLFETDQKPFLVGADRFPVYKRDIVDVLPGYVKLINVSFILLLILFPPPVKLTATI